VRIASTFHLNVQILQDCYQKHIKKDSKFKTLYDAVSARMRHAAGETHWHNAVNIYEETMVENRSQTRILRRCSSSISDDIQASDARSVESAESVESLGDLDDVELEGYEVYLSSMSLHEKTPGTKDLCPGRTPGFSGSDTSSSSGL